MKILISQPFTRLKQQGCSTNASGNYMLIDAITTLWFSFYPFEYVSLHISSISHSFLNTRLFVKNFWHIQWTFQNKINPSVSPFNQVVIFPSRNPPQKCLIASLQSILPRFRNYYISQKLLKSQHQSSCPTHYAERTGNIPLIGKIGERHWKTRSDNYTPKFSTPSRSHCAIEFSRNNLTWSKTKTLT